MTCIIENPIAQTVAKEVLSIGIWEMAKKLEFRSLIIMVQYI